MGEGESGRTTHVATLDPVDPFQRGENAGSPCADDVTADSVDVELGAGDDDPVELALGEDDAGEALSSGDEFLAELALGVGVAGSEALGVSLVGQATTDDLGPGVGVLRCPHRHGEAEAVEQLWAQLALFGVHRPDEQEAGIVADRDRFALDDGDARRGGVQERVDQVVGKQVHLVDVEDSPVGSRQQAGFEGVITSQGTTEVDRAE